MQKYIERMKVKLKELDLRIKKAEEAVQNVPFGMDSTGKDLLEQQIDAMKHYRAILSYRIEYEAAK